MWIWKRSCMWKRVFLESFYLIITYYENGEYLASIMDNSAIMSDGVIESHGKETKGKISIFTCILINYYSIIYCFYLLLFV